MLMMATQVQPLHSFMNRLFQETPSFQEEVEAKYEQEERQDEEEAQEKQLRAIRCVTTIVLRLGNAVDRQINIVQDNACAHNTMGCYTQQQQQQSFNQDLELSNSDLRWSHERSAGQHKDNKDSNAMTSMAQKPRFPRRRLSMESMECISADYEAKIATSFPQCPRRRGTMEFVAPGDQEAAATTPTSSEVASAASPRIPQRRGTMDMTLAPPASTTAAVAATEAEAVAVNSSNRPRVDDTAESRSIQGPKIPQRRGTMDMSMAPSPATTKNCIRADAAIDTKTPMLPPTSPSSGMSRANDTTLNTSIHGPKLPRRRETMDMTIVSGASTATGSSTVSPLQ